VVFDVLEAVETGGWGPTGQVAGDLEAVPPSLHSGRSADAQPGGARPFTIIVVRAGMATGLKPIMERFNND